MKSGFGGIDFSLYKDRIIIPAIKMCSSRKEKVILSEGYTDRYLYKNCEYFSEFTFVPNLSLNKKNKENTSLNKKEVIKYANDFNNVLGVVDSDYEGMDFTCDRIVNINYYSKENIFLMYYSEFNELKKKLVSTYLNDQNVKYLKLGYVKRNGTFDIDIIRNIVNDKKTYIDNFIKCEDTFLRFTGIKDVFIQFKEEFLSIDLHDKKLLKLYLDLKNIEFLFDESNKKRIQNFSNHKL